MQSEVRVANVSLQSLESAIAETVRSGANSEEIRRVVEAATLRFHDNHKKTRTFHSASRYLFNRVHLFGLLCCALVVFLIAFTVSFRAQQISQRNQVELKDVWENINVLMGITTDDGVGDGEKDNHAAEPAVSQYASAANYLARFLANDVPATRSKPTICPLDAFFHDECQERDGGTVCIFPGAILKRIDAENWESEINGFRVLNDTRYFPELYYVDSNCRTVLEENVSPPGYEEGLNRCCANYTYYEEFYKSAFEIFDRNNIIPEDLNICCNTIVHGHHIRIIDFGRYTFNQPPQTVRSRNKVLLQGILSDIVDKMNRSSCTSFYRRQKQYNLQ